MNKNMGIRPALLLMLAVWLAGCSVTVQANETAAIEEGTMRWAFTRADQHPDQMLIEVINSATETLDIAIYSLTHPDIVRAIKEAKQRGVAVRVITDKIQASGKSQTEALKILGSAGIPLKQNSHSGLMHLKLTIADRKIATTGSFNYSKAASTTNDDMLVVIHDREVAEKFSEQFENIWNDTERFEPINLRIAQDVPPSGNGRSLGGQGENRSIQEEGDILQLQEKTEERSFLDEAVNVQESSACGRPAIKGNISSTGEKIYHVPGSTYYERTEAEAMFCTEQEAEAAGFRAAKK